MRKPYLWWRVAKGAAQLGWAPAWRVRRGPARGLRLSVERSSGDYWSGRNELPVQRAIVQLLRPGDTFIDVGANIGFFSLLAARLVGPGGRVVACEPVPDNVQRLRANAARNGIHNLDIVPAAIGQRSGRAVLALANHPGGSALEEAGRPLDYRGQLDVEVTTLDALMTRGAWQPPAMVKIDVEGAEAAVLEGMRGTAATAHPVILVEADGPTAEELGRRIGALTGQLVDLGYDVERLSDSYSNRRWHVAHLVARPQDSSSNHSAG